jgi:alkylation response protein AidB-like acyl-CoA dehydrogenase
LYFGLSSEQSEFQHAVRDFFARSATSADVRRLMDDERGYDEATWRRMADQLGLQGLGIPEEHGGSGGGFVELAVALEEAGRALAGGPWFASTVLAATALQLSGDDDAAAEFLPGIASGGTIATLAVVDDDGSWELRDQGGVTARRTADGFELTGSKSYVLDGQVADLVLVPARSEDGLCLFAVDGDAAGLTVTPLPVLDQTRRMSRLAFTAVPARLVGTAGAAEPVLARTLQRAAVALAAEQVGGARRCLEMTVDYAKIRVQFNRPIGGFQAVKHIAADMYTLVETASSAALYAAWCVATDSDEVPTVASLAKAYSSDAFYRVAADAIQLHGGIGFTWEHDCHLYFKRASAGLQFLGTPQHHRELLAQGIKL